MARKPKAATSSGKALDQKETTSCYLTDLHFDKRNPRFGPTQVSFSDEVKVLDYIVDTFGVEDVLSSLAVNGYFASEPLIGIKDGKDTKIHILEGNRRLAACLILARDPRAKNQKRRQDHYGIIRAKHGNKPINPVPVFIFSGPHASKDLLPYLGVRHIVGSTDWDSYAKAAWVANVIETGDLKLADVLEMIGDDSRQSERLLSAYYFVNQLKEEGRFAPNQSIRKGRGSNAEFPFSLVYNALGYIPIAKWVGLAGKEPTNQSPIPKGKLDNAESLMTFLCGNSTTKTQPAINDSREISKLAKAISDSAQVMALKAGKSLEEAVVEALPAKERLADGFGDVRSQMQTLLGVIGRGTLDASDATELLPLSREVRNLAVKLNTEILKSANQDDSDE